MNTGNGRSSMHDSWNFPKTRNCFFCMEDKLCKLLNLPEELLSTWKEQYKDNKIAMEVLNELQKASFASCDNCKRDKHKVAEVVAEYVTNCFQAGRLL